jgi:hypothetical protein
MSEEKKTTLAVVENGAKENEPTANPQDAAQVQVDNKEEANDAIPKVEEVLANKRQEIASMASEEDLISYVVPFSKIIAEGRAQGDTVFICGPMIVEGEVTILAGDTNACKSTVAYSISDAISKGEEFLGTSTLKSEALYVETEMSSKQLYNRFKDVVVNDNFNYIDAIGKDMGWILDQVGSYCKVRNSNEKLVVVIDSITIASKSAITAKVARETMQRLKAMCKLYGITVLVLVHNKKRDKKKPLQISDIQGSGKLVDMADNVFAMARCGGSEVYIKTLKLRSSRIEDTVKHLEVVDYPHLTVDFIQDTDEEMLLAKAESSSTKITPEVELEIISLHKAGNSIRAIATEVGRSKTVVGRIVKKHKKDEANVASDTENEENN